MGFVKGDRLLCLLWNNLHTTSLACSISITCGKLHRVSVWRICIAADVIGSGGYVWLSDEESLLEWLKI